MSSWHGSYLLKRRLNFAFTLFLALIRTATFSGAVLVLIDSYRKRRNMLHSSISFVFVLLFQGVLSSAARRS
jgi:hypothetical protein